jgi:glycosyltransferase involved in cell wall biosynthesis
VVKKKRVAVCAVQTPFVYGGAEVHVRTLVSELSKRGYAAELINIPFKNYPPIRVPQESLVWRMLDLEEATAEKIDLVIGTKYPSYGVKHPNKVTWLIHQFREIYDLYGTKWSDYGPDAPAQYEAVRQWIKKFDEITLTESRMIFANSENVRKRLLHYNKIESITLYHPPGLHGRYQTGNYERYVLSVGRLEKLKRIDLLIKAIAKTETDIRCKIVGRGPELERLQNLANKLAVMDRVDFLGFVSENDLIQLYANAGVVYYAPFDEDYGYVTLEAFFSGRPVITCTDSGGTLEFVKNEHTGFVVKPDSDLIAEAIRKAINNPLKAKEMGHEGLKMVQPITWDNVIEQLTKTIR